MNQFKLRFTYEDICDKKTISDYVIMLNPIKYYIADEIGKKTGKRHIQCYIVIQQKAPWLRKKFQEFVKKQKPDYVPQQGKNNAYYSVSETREQDGTLPYEYIGYLMKEDVNPIIHKLSQEDLSKSKEAKATYDKEQEEKKIKKKAKKTFNRMSAVREAFLNHPVYLKQKDTTQGLSVSSICDFVVEYYKTEELTVMEFHMKNIVQTLCLIYVPSYRRSLSQRIEDMVMPRI